MLQLADYGLESLEALQACNGLWEGVALYNCEGEEGIFVIITDVCLFLTLALLARSSITMMSWVSHDRFSLKPCFRSSGVYNVHLPIMLISERQAVYKERKIRYPAHQGALLCLMQVYVRAPWKECR